MAMDPFSGEETFSANSLGAQIGIDTAQSIGVDAPLAFRMAEHLPGFATSAGFSAYRGSNTIMRGGFLEGEGKVGRRLAGRRAAKYRVMDQSGIVGAKQTSHFIGGRTERRAIGRKLGLAPRDNMMTRRAGRLMNRADKPGFVRSARVNNMTARPRAFGRYHSISVFGGDTYTPFGASKTIGNSSRVRSMFEKAGVTGPEGQSLMGPGLFSFVSAARKTDKLEQRLMQRASSGKSVTRLEKKLGKVDRSISGIMRMNNAEAFTSSLSYSSGAKTISYGEALKMSPLERGGLGAAEFSAKSRPLLVSGSPGLYERSTASMVGVRSGTAAGGGVVVGGNVGVRGNMMASSMYGAGSQYLAGYFRGAGGFGAVEGLGVNAAKGAAAAEARFGNAFVSAFGKDTAVTMRSGRVVKGADEAIKFLQSTGGKSFFREVGAKGVGKLATSGGGRMLAARAGMLAIPGLNVVAAAMMAYDLGQMAGEVIKSGINLAKDAQKSMKGSISKPMFGMGYKDTEAAATSRSRGVMAIQNSQLNARSALGHEASSLAAHFG